MFNQLYSSCVHCITMLKCTHVGLTPKAENKVLVFGYLCNYINVRSGLRLVYMLIHLPVLFLVK